LGCLPWLTYAKGSVIKRDSRVYGTIADSKQGLGPLIKWPQARGTARPQPDDIRLSRKPGGIIAEYGAAIFGGAVLIAAFGFAGHFIGRNAAAHMQAPIEASFIPVEVMKSPIADSGKGALLLDLASLDVQNLKVSREQVIMSENKGDLLIANSPITADLPPRAVKTVSANIATPVGVRIEPASANIKDEPKAAVKRLVLQPKVAAVEDAFMLPKETKQKVIAQRRMRLAEENCLARAVYFEARSESELGQMAVAKVIINRTHTDGYPRTICGVVYQGSGSRNSCQFSFACDGLPDDVKQPAAWAQSKRIAQKAMSGNANLGQAMGLATNYHADYVKPKWSKTMRRLIQIGHHIFYSDEG
jgi:spore germination cell wall hydrolase CwlJ-like protein